MRGLAGFTAAPGNYQLSFDRRSIRDLADESGSGSADVAWTRAFSNHPPVLTALANRSLNEGQVLMLTNTVSDPDADTIAFTLGTNAPVGATVGLTTGVFRWQPSSIQGGQTYAITVIATDSGTPALSDQKTFLIEVRDTLPDAVLTVGRTNLFAGESSSVPLLLESGRNVTQVVFEIAPLPMGLESFRLQAPGADVVAAAATLVDSNRLAVSFQLRDSVPSGKPLILARLTFDSAKDAEGNLTLPPQAFAATVTGLNLRNVKAVQGRAIVVGLRPVLTLDVPGEIAIFSQLDVTYQIQRQGSGGSGIWEFFDQVTSETGIHTGRYVGDGSAALFRAVIAP